jgi:methanethiol S-methyltransferase
MRYVVGRKISMLRAPVRIFWLLCNVTLGLVPSLLFFAWVERNCSLPWLPIEWGWPWISLSHWPVLPQAVWNACLFLLFSFFHSALAQARVQQAVQKLIPLQAVRSFYLAFTGISLIVLMALWQSTGTILWSLPLPATALGAISFLIFWGLFLISMRMVARLDFLEFMGLRQLYQSAEGAGRPQGTPRLIEDGIYARIRHPIYFFTLLAFAAAPFMTLDRAIVLGASALYLAIGIPIEERKLVTLFGESYVEYRKRVPAVLPRFK